MSERAVLRATALHLDRYRNAIQAEVDRRLDRAEPPPAARAEIIRRFRTFCRLSSLDYKAARPSLDGLAGNDPAVLERTVQIATDVAIQCCPRSEVATVLRDLELRFRAGIRRVMQPQESSARSRSRRRKTPNAGKRVRSAIDRISDAYVALCLDSGKVYDLNPAAEALLGVDAATLLQRPLADLVPDHSRVRYRNLEARLDAGEDSGLLGIAFSRGDGGTVHTEASIASHTIAGKRLAIFVLRERIPEIH